MRKLYTSILLFFLLTLSLSSFGQINAVDDLAYPVQPSSTTVATTVGNVTANDTLNGVVVTTYNTDVSPITTGPLSIDSQGVLTLAPNTTSGTYTITYQLCEVLAMPSNCDTATATVVVLNIIEANDDVYQVANVTTTTIGNVMNNDTFNGVAVISSLTDLTPITTGPLSIDANGVLTLAPNTPSGTYTITYQLCENGAIPQNCDIATATVVVSTTQIITAVDDSFVFDSLGGITPSVLNNDTINGVPVIPNLGSPNSVFATAISVPAGLTFNPDGTISVSPNLPSGTYPVVYQICEALNPINCDTAVVTIVVNYIPLEIDMVATYNDYNNDGFVNVGDVINYQITLTNIGTTTMTNLTACQYSMNVSGGTLASLNAGASNSTFFTGVHVITQAEINAGNVFGLLCICAGSGEQNCLDGINTPLSQSNGIKLQAFIDSNSNGIKDASESFFSGGYFNYSINSGATTSLYSSTGINYLYESNPATTYNFSYTTPNAYYTCPTTYTNITVPNGSGITTYNFPITVIPYTDLAVYLSPSGGPRPGFSYYNYFTIKNNGTQTITSGTVTFTKDNALSISTLPLGATATATGFTYNFTNLLPYEIRYVYLGLQVPTIPTVSLGQLVTNTVSVTIPSGDANVINNNASLTQDIRGAYDPNDKHENHGGKILHSTFTSNDYLMYTIRFENTGNANAITVRVDDVLDADLDENSIIMVASSHNYVLSRIGSNLSWKLDGIDLPPSVPNTQIGHGYITFQIKPDAGYAIGDIIPNFANIYFDFNPAIITDVCNTEFVATLSNQNFAFNNLNYYPNPVKNSLSISNASLIEEIEITSLLGQKILTKKINELQTELNLSELSNGVYFVKVRSEGQEKTMKIIKE
ncbi:T9SS type A sorting domain-containing protein [Flavobacterium koreense]